MGAIRAKVQLRLAITGWAELDAHPMLLAPRGSYRGGAARMQLHSPAVRNFFSIFELSYSPYVPNKMQF